MTDLDGGDADNPGIAMPSFDDEQDDRELVALALRDATAFGALYRRHLPRVYRYALAHLGDVHVAQEVTSQTFLAALEGLAGYRAEGVFGAWLLRIARNKVADARRSRRPTVPLELAGQAPATDASPERVALARLELEEVTRILQALAPERAEAVTLRIFAGLSLAEAAAVMGKSEDAVKMLVHRAIRDVRERLARRNEVEP